jgi:hypothetical protein
MTGMAPNGWNKPWPFGLCLFGMLMLVLAIIGIFTGKAYYRGSVSRAENPSNYWGTLIVQFVGGIVLILVGYSELTISN